MIRLLIGSISIASLISTSTLAGTATMPTYTSPTGSDYFNAQGEIWTEDAMNDFLSMANSFACIVKNSGQDSQPNSTYEALISEVECGLADLNSSGTNASTLSRSVIMSSRASATSVQEATAYFNSTSNDSGFLTQMQFTKSPEDFAPYGTWYVAYLMAENGGTLYDTTDTPMWGIVDISETAAGSIVIQSADTQRGFEKQQARIEYTDSTLNSATMVGRYFGQDRQSPPQAINTVVAGRTSATRYFRVSTDYTTSTVTSACFKRNATWSNVYKYGVYDKTTGTKVKLSGAFGFKYGANNNQGWFDHNGAWFDQGLFAFNNSDNNANLTKTVAVTSKADVPYTLSWAPGKLQQRSVVNEPLLAGNNNFFRAWANNTEYNVILNGTTLQYTYHPMNVIAAPANAVANPHAEGSTPTKNIISVTDISAAGYDWLGQLYSPSKQAEVYWAGGTTFEVEVRVNKSDDATLLAASFTLMDQLGDSGFKNMPLNRANWNVNAAYAHAKGASSSADGDNFFFTGLNPVGVALGLLPRTLYLDVGSNGPDANDKPVMFDFSINEMTGKYYDYTDDTIADWNAASDWPAYDLSVVDANGVKYRWEFGAYPWDHSVIALKSDGTVKTMDKPLVFEYTHDTAYNASDYDIGNEVNSALTGGLTYKADKNGRFPAKSLCTANASTHFDCTVLPTSFNGKKFILRYNGNNLQGLPYQEATYTDGGSKGYGIKLVNLKDATEVIETTSGITYVLKAIQTGKTFVPATLAEYNPSNIGAAAPANCDGLSFDGTTNAIANLGDTPGNFVVGNLPDITDFAKWPQTSALWSDMPNAANLKCTVVMGDTSDCED